MQLEIRDRPTDRQTDITTYRAAIAAKTKMGIASKVVAIVHYPTVPSMY